MSETLAAIAERVWKKVPECRPQSLLWQGAFTARDAREGSPTYGEQVPFDATWTLGAQTLVDEDAELLIIGACVKYAPRTFCVELPHAEPHLRWWAGHNAAPDFTTAGYEGRGPTQAIALLLAVESLSGKDTHAE